MTHISIFIFAIFKIELSFYYFEFHVNYVILCLMSSCTLKTEGFWAALNRLLSIFTYVLVEHDGEGGQRLKEDLQSSRLMRI